MKTKILSTLLIVSLIACQKDDPAPAATTTPTPTTTTSNTPPTISVTEPSNNFTLNLGESFTLEGIGFDSEGLSNINYTIESPTASYNYNTASNITATGSPFAFNESITIPDSAAVGDALLKIYCTDTDNNQSSIISRDFKINDNIPPVITSLKDSVGATDLIVVQVYKNSNNVVDSILIVNQTKSENIATIKDIGGFKTIVCSILDAGIHPTKESFHDITNSTVNSYNYQVDIIGSSYGSTLSIGFREYDSVHNNSVPYVDYSIVFKI